jgi:hypothetical protein
MSLCYHSEHLAWQQRVNQERSRAQNFYKTTGSFYSSPNSTRNPFPSANQDLVPSNYKSLNFNLAYTFGGTKPIRHALIDSPRKKTEETKPQARPSRSIETPKVSKSHLKKYAEELKIKIQEEKLKRAAIEKELKVIH